MDSSLRPGVRRTLALLAAFGPGLMVMLADTDAGSVITAAESGRLLGLHMVLPEILLIPVLYLVQEVAVRLGVVTGKGHGELIRDTFGLLPAVLSVATLAVSAVGALVTEMSGLTGVGALLGLPSAPTVAAAVLFLLAVAVLGQYRHVETIGVLLGLAEGAFLAAALLHHPSARAFADALGPAPSRDALSLLAANVGAVVMPWMIFYQQGAVLDKGLRAEHLHGARLDTAFGAVLTQLIMAALVVLGAEGPSHAPFGQVAAIAGMLAPVLGRRTSALVFGLGMTGASLVASLVVALAAAYSLGEVFRFPHSVSARPREAPAFFGVYAGTILAGAGAVLLSRNLVRLSVDVEVMNAVLLPVVLGFLLALEARALRPPYRLSGAKRLLTWGVAAAVMAFGLLTAASLVA